MNLISFRDVNPYPPWEIERQIMDQELRVEAHIQESAGWFDDYLSLVAEVIKGRRKNGDKEGER